MTKWFWTYSKRVSLQKICNHGCEASKNTFRPLGGHAVLVPKILHAKITCSSFFGENGEWALSYYFRTPLVKSWHYEEICAQFVRGTCKPILQPLWERVTHFLQLCCFEQDLVLVSYSWLKKEGRTGWATGDKWWNQDLQYVETLQLNLQ